MTYYDTIYEYAADNYGLITSGDAKALGIPNVELVKLAHRGRIHRVGHGVYRIEHYIPTAYDKYAEAVALTGNGAVIYGESVLAIHRLGLVNPTIITVAVKTRIRKLLPAYIKPVYPKSSFTKTYYEGIPSQSIFEAILVCKGIVMKDRLVDAVSEAARQGLVSEAEAISVRKELQ